MSDLVVPALGESITEAVISRWHKKIGEAVEADEPVVALETDKITVDLPAPAAGALTEQRFAEGDTVKVGDVVGTIGEGTAAKAAPSPAPTATPTPTPTPTSTPTSKPSMSPSPSTGDGGNGRAMTPSQRRAKLEGQAPAPQKAEAAPTAVATPARTPASSDAREEVVPMTPIRKRIAQRLVEAQKSAAALTTFNEIDMTAVMALRERFKQEFADQHGVKLGFMSFFAKACIAALRLFPGLNAEVKGDAIVYKKHYDLGIAVSTERGLVVPVLRDADRLSFAGLEQGIANLAGRAKTGKLTLDELVGGTFSITNGGIYGSMLSTPLLNYPQTGILGMHNIVERPMAVNGQMEIRPIMYAALTYDHRVVDGREAVSFLVAVKQRIEQPDRLMFEL
ncbi:MAG TPA: 2-oxoglutarate dehydrogenase complex dihydrolipoyllysine-residue succinyltransferase [Kofleriaceae bacterium]|nr:2-oxoglutarate dehydrogenase complex dihydrolipoyllysine-residue succinyltransferase [Kofleriaceae bacterium]